MTAVFDARICALGEGPLWHPERQQLFWFDITGCRLLTQTAAGPADWPMPRMASAAGWIDRDRLLIATETALCRFDLQSGEWDTLCPLEADNPATRSNDGRADPKGGFWIGTMGKQAEAGAGAIYRLHRGELRRLFPGISIPNAICFTPDGRHAHFADSARRTVWRVALDDDGWPAAEPQVFLDLTGGMAEPDGAVVDAEGVLWLALWGAGQVAAYAPDGQRLRDVALPAPHSTCPAFGGPGLTTLFCTTALQGMDEAARAVHPDAGKTFALPNVARGQREHQVIL